MSALPTVAAADALALEGDARKQLIELPRLVDDFALIDDEKSGMTPAIAAQSKPFALLRIGRPVISS